MYPKRLRKCWLSVQLQEKVLIWCCIPVMVCHDCHLWWVRISHWGSQYMTTSALPERLVHQRDFWKDLSSLASHLVFTPSIPPSFPPFFHSLSFFSLPPTPFFSLSLFFLLPVLALIFPSPVEYVKGSKQCSSLQIPTTFSPPQRELTLHEADVEGDRLERQKESGSSLRHCIY